MSLSIRDCVDRWSKTDQLNAHAKGLEALRSFANERLGEDKKRLSYRVTTTATEDIFFNGEEKSGSEATQASVAKSTKGLFGRLLVIGLARKLSMEKLMSCPLGTIPLSIATQIEVQSTVKSTLLKIIEENAEGLTTIPPGVAWIVDAMAILQVTKTTISTTYSELVSTVLNSIIRSIPSCRRLHRLDGWRIPWGVYQERRTWS